MCFPHSPPFEVPAKPASPLCPTESRPSLRSLPCSPPCPAPLPRRLQLRRDAVHRDPRSEKHSRPQAATVRLAPASDDACARAAVQIGLCLSKARRHVGVHRTLG